MARKRHETEEHYATPEFTGRYVRAISYYTPAAIETRSRSRREKTRWVLAAAADAKKDIMTAVSPTDADIATPLLAAKEAYAACKERHLTDRKEIRDLLLPDVIAAFGVAAKETLGFEPRDLQIQAATLLYEGNGEKGVIADMKTGEGKTITAALNAAMFAVDGGSVHVATRNDYLARRDGLQMAAIYNALGLTVGVIQSTGETYVYNPYTQTLEPKGRNGVGRDAAYACDIVYGVGSEFGFDFLRDNSATHKSQLRQVRGRVHMVVDEADDVMVNQATTPLIMQREAKAASTKKEVVLEIGEHKITFSQMTRFMASFVDGLEEGKVDDPGGYFKQVKRMITQRKFGKLQKRKDALFRPSGDFVPNYVTGEIYPTSVGYARLQKELYLKLFRTLPQVNEFTKYAEGLFSNPEVASKLLYFLQNALKARCFYHNGQDYQVLRSRQTGLREVVIIDTATLGGGRPLVGRRFEDDLHAAIEAKERRLLPEKERATLPITSDRPVGAAITFQNYFALYDTLAGMTGTATYSAEEFYNAYGTDVVMIPRHTKSKMINHTENMPLLFKTREGQFRWMMNEIKRRYFTVDANKIKIPTQEELEQRGITPEEAEKERIAYMNNIGYLRPILVGLQTPGDVDAFFREYLLPEVTKFILNPMQDEQFAKYMQANFPELLTPGQETELRNFLAIVTGNIKGSINLQSLTAENSADEEARIANAGKLMTITVTCMAGRGTDIKLGGEHGTLSQHDVVNDRGGLYILGEHGSPESDEQLVGRGARWEDNGEAILVARADGLLIERSLGREVARYFRETEMGDNDYYTGPDATRHVQEWQQHVLQQGVDSRKHLIELYRVQNEQRTALYRDREQIVSADNIDNAAGRIFELVVDDIVTEYEQERQISASDVLADELVTKIASLFPNQSLATLGSAQVRKLLRIVRAVNGNPGSSANLLYLLDHLSPEERALLAKKDLRGLLVSFLEERYVAATVDREFKAREAIPTSGSIVSRQIQEREAAEQVLEAERQMMLAIVDEEWTEQMQDLKQIERARWLQNPATIIAKGFNGAENPDVWYIREAGRRFDGMKRRILEQIARALLASPQVATATEAS